ncbi:hypothetical protein A2995_01470 [Candidatus Nomurabacteria bacterium RIFCSPLOWO2_01_FULL_33_24]|uniref:Uncharacterized protein n=1 Tax=Candidatus Nomurabacteria bacterium RIFCSPLOWO2_01_FULL_33_24 TaxID=1801765 RepID=A0A1F6X2W3_9BACT|nr:MAG: hypothetical protein A2995_01470 [Candidatus Nomurabacteria bacterium RIFCSPLOWO2_01_FULL_33_24]
MAGKLDPSVIKAIKRAWGLTDKNIVIESSEKLSNLDKGQLTGKNRTITFIPSKGLQRIFAGNIGGTCIDSIEEDFAKGKFENITSYSLVLDEGKTTERFAGAFLVIETETENKEPTLVIRSNNPSENLFSMVDGDSLIKNILDQVKSIANKRGIKHVTVPVSDCGRSSSNREVISQFYKTNFSNNPKLGLVKNKETEFNGYPIWNKNGKDAVVEI